MIITLSKNPIARISCFLENKKEERKIKNERTTKIHYECCVCGYMLAPYFTEDDYGPTNCGWHIVQNEFSKKWNRWVCHKCADHGYAREKERNETYRELTWEEWQDEVEKCNAEIKTAIKNKDKKYYEERFND